MEFASCHLMSWERAEQGMFHRSIPRTSPIVTMAPPSLCSERTEIVNAHMRQKKDMNDMISAMEGEFGDAETELRQEFEAQREEIKNRNSEEYNVLKIQLEGIIEVRESCSWDDVYR